MKIGKEGERKRTPERGKTKSTTSLDKLEVQFPGGTGKARVESGKNKRKTPGISGIFPSNLIYGHAGLGFWRWRKQSKNTFHFFACLLDVCFS